MKNLNKFFFTFEGVEGAGKSTVAKLIYEKLKNENFNVFLTREPGGNNLKFSEEIRNLIFNNEDITAYTELFLFEASRREHFEKVILPNLKHGKILLCDRFTDSTIVYQGLKSVNKEDINQLNKIATMNIFPSKTFILDIDPKISIERIKKNKSREMNKFDKASIYYHYQVRKAYLKLAKTNRKRYVVINADQSIDKVASDIYNLIKRFLK